jgi:hypothetical protein
MESANAGTATIVPIMAEGGEVAEENVENSSEVNVTIGANQLRRRSGTSLVTISRSLTRCNCMAQSLSC